MFVPFFINFLTKLFKILSTLCFIKFFIKDKVKNGSYQIIINEPESAASRNIAF